MEKPVVFTTTDPGFMGSAGSDFYVERKDPKIIGLWKNVYIHGKAESKAGYDIPAVVDGTLEFKPEQDCILALKDGVTIPCVLIAWEVIFYDKAPAYKGFICDKTDNEALAYARVCQAEKRLHT